MRRRLARPAADAGAAVAVDWVQRRRRAGAVDPRLVFGLGVTGTPLNLTVRWPGPTWRTQVIDDDAALEAAIRSMERPLVVVEPA